MNKFAWKHYTLVLLIVLPLLGGCVVPRQMSYEHTIEVSGVIEQHDRPTYSYTYSLKGSH